MDFAVELSLDDASEAAVIRQWQALLDAGLPSQAEHRSMTNAPHVTLVAGRDLPPDLPTRARELLAPLLPTPLAVRGLLVLGEGPRVTLAHLVEPTPEVADAVACLRAGLALRHPVWTPHLTLARRMPRARLAEALDVLASAPQPRPPMVTRLRWWDPDRRVIEELV